jgi:hypothetical protein
LRADERLGEAALPSLALVLVGLVPVILLSRTLRAPGRRLNLRSPPRSTAARCAGLRNTTSPVGTWITRISLLRVKLLAARLTASDRSLTSSWREPLAGQKRPAMG